MKNKKKRISYIRKPMPKQSFFSLAFAVVGLVCFGFSLGNSIVNQGSGGPDVAAWALTSLLFSVEAVICGVKTLKMKEVNYILARIGTIVGGVLLFCWLGMLVFCGLRRYSEFFETAGKSVSGKDDNIW